MPCCASSVPSLPPTQTMSGRNSPRRLARSISTRSRAVPFMARLRPRKCRSLTRRVCRSFPCRACRRTGIEYLHPPNAEKLRLPVNLSLAWPWYSRDGLLSWGIAEHWCRAKPGEIMRLSNLLRPRPKYSFTLVILPILAITLASPASAEPASNPPSAEYDGNPPSAQNGVNPPAAQNGGNPPSAEAKPNDAAEQAAAAQPKPGSAPAQPKSVATPRDGESAGNGSQILINIDKSRQEMTVFVDGIEKYTWPVSTGKRGYSTPSGTYTASSMNEIWYSKQWDNAPMPHAIFYMKDGHAIHGTLEERNLGKPASHGCVRISRANAMALYALVKETGLKNTQVVLSGTTPGGEAQVATQPAYPRYGEGYGAPWFGPGPSYDPRFDRPRRGLFGGWFRQQPYGGPQGYYRPPRGYYRGY